jgi:hypothetical protein
MLVQHAAIKQLLRFRYARRCEMHRAEFLVGVLSDGRLRKDKSHTCRDGRCE